MTQSFSLRRSCVIALHFLLYLLLAMTISCLNPTSDEGGGSEPTGSLTLSISDGVSALDVTLDIDMDPAFYNVSGVGPGNRSFRVTNVQPGTDVAVDRLLAGSWTVTVTALNEDAVSIGSGTATVTITPGGQTGASVTVRPFDGTGTFNLTIRWEEGVIYGDTQDAEATLTSSGGESVTDVEMTQNGASFTGTAAPLEAGYYILSMKLLDNGYEIWPGAIDTVRIVKNGTSTGDFLLTPDDVDPIIGDIDVGIINEFNDPLDVSLTVSDSPVNAGGVDPAVITSQVTTEGFDPESALYTWFVDGDLQEGAGSDSLSLYPDDLVTLKPDQGQGARVFRVDLVVTDGTALSSATATIVLVYPDVIAHDDWVWDGEVPEGQVAAIAADETYPGGDTDLNGWSFENIGDDEWVQGPLTEGFGTKINWYFFGDATHSVKVSDLETYWVELQNRSDTYGDGEMWIQLYTHPEGEGDGGSWYRSTARYYLTNENFPQGEKTLFSVGSVSPDAARFVGIDGTENAIHKDIMSPDSGEGPYDPDNTDFADQTILAIALATNSAAEPGVLEFTALGAGYKISGMGQREFITVAGESEPVR